MFRFINLNPKTRCDHCGPMDYQNAKLTEMLSWLCNRLQSVDGDDMTDLLRENCSLDSWWKDHKRSYQTELRRKAEENQKKQEIETALSKLSAREKELLKLQ